MEGATLTKVPTASHFKLSSEMSSKNKEESKEIENIPYAQVMGSIMYSIVSTRTYITYAISFLSRFMGNLGRDHWYAMKWLLRYINGTTEVGLMCIRRHVEV